MLNRILPRTCSLLNSASYNFRHYCLSSILKMKIGTHDGVFHCDEVLACFMLKNLPQYKDAEIIRTRDLNKLNDCDIVVDVGSVFDHEKKRYDHHQAGFNETLSTLRPELGDSYKIKLSSAGLVYAYYGEDIIQQLKEESTSLTNEDLKLIYKKVYESFIQEIDAIDNGIPMTEEQPKYDIHTHLSNRVKRLNPEWNSTQETNVDEFFNKAMALVSEDFLYFTRYYINTWFPARNLVRKAIDNRFQIHKSGEIVVFNERFPWKYHLFDLEQELGIEPQIKYVLFNDKPKSWRVQAVPIDPMSFVLRKALHSAWRGIRDDNLSSVSGIEGCIFCHSNGFIGGNTTLEGALKMAIASLEANE